MNDKQNILRIKVVHDALGELSKEVIFVGGATVALYVDRPSPEARPTDDIDVLIEIVDYMGYTKLEEVLRQKGFENDKDSGIICRFIVKGIIVDVMPTAEKILGFSNMWYKEGVANSTWIQLDNAYNVRIFTPEYFIATKLEAFKGRGNNDGRTSSDFEDIIYVLNGRSTIWNEFKESTPNVKRYLKDEFNALLQQSYIDEWISCHLDYNEQRRGIYILESLREFVQSM